jgi:hypothetical protein
MVIVHPHLAYPRLKPSQFVFSFSGDSVLEGTDGPSERVITADRRKGSVSF